MPKKIISRRQAWKTGKIAAERLSRAQRRAAQAESIVASGHLGPKQDGRIVANFGTNFSVEDSEGIIRHCLVRRTLPRLVCGDYVSWQTSGADMGIIVQLYERQSLLSRPDFNQQLKPVAANIQQILVVAAPQPSLDDELVDRFLIAARLTEIQPVIVINKTDLLNRQQLRLLRERLGLYESLGYRVVFTNTIKRDGLKPLVKQLNHQTSIFVGQSGVGKSSIIKTLLPTEDIRIGELSKSSGQGKHTTTVSILYRLNQGGYLIDSPGVREFGLGHVSQPRIAQGFIEFNELLGHCKFNDCTHISEPRCAILQAVNNGRIHPTRYQRYRKIVETLGHR